MGNVVKNNREWLIVIIILVLLQVRFIHKSLKQQQKLAFLLHSCIDHATWDGCLSPKRILSFNFLGLHQIHVLQAPAWMPGVWWNLVISVYVPLKRFKRCFHSNDPHRGNSRHLFCHIYNMLLFIIQAEIGHERYGQTRHERKQQETTKKPPRHLFHF